jgi:2-polyprenyl-6-methoxyphenol hydroxylase-like FAD-dependent oxidoreductase
MTSLSPPQTDVLIVGAGPNGLVRALAVHARTLELYGQIGLADARGLLPPP